MRNSEKGKNSEKPKSEGMLENDKLLIEIKRIYWDNNRAYGGPRIWDQLRTKENIPCSLNRVARLMNRAGIVAVQKGTFLATTDSGHDYPVWPNVVNRSFRVEWPNSVWVTDITYVWTYEGCLYVAAESFFHTLKVELIHRTTFKTREEAKNRIFEYVEMYYHRERAHSTLDYLSPFEYEKQAMISLQSVH